MDPFGAFGEHAAKAASAYRILSRAASTGAPCPSIESIGREVGLGATTLRTLLNRMESADLIRTTYPSPARRVVEIIASGNKTAPTQTSGDAAANASLAAKSAAQSGPRLTMTPEQFVAAGIAAGRFEDSAAARRDLGWPKNVRDLPQSAMVFSGCGISDVYGSTGIRTGAGCPL